MLALILLVGCVFFDGTLSYEEYEDFDESYSYEDEKDLSATPLITDLVRVRRYPDVSSRSSQQDDKDVDDTLKKIMVGRSIDDWDTETNSAGANSPTTTLDYLTDHQLTTEDKYHWLDYQTTEDKYNYVRNKNYKASTKQVERQYDWTPMNVKIPARTIHKEIDRNIDVNSMTREFMDSSENPWKDIESDLGLGDNGTTSGYEQEFTSTTETSASEFPVFRADTTESELANKTTKTRKKTKTTRPFDIEKFLEIVANLTYDYYTNLTDQVNETLIKMKVPTCGTPTTTAEPTTTMEPGPPDYSGIAKYLVGKCFVCGLEEPGIPYNARCADAFAGDFIPLVPQDPSAKGHIARFRKYCRYKDVDNFELNSTMPRSMFGRWTGGCSVRWSDVSGVYTQRACRNRKQPATGRHFASKRMAKLEATLAHTENGCIISPVATLLPLSRGISLYARFHACVCTGNWCNGAMLFDSDVWMTLTAVFVGMIKSLYAVW